MSDDVTAVEMHKYNNSNTSIKIPSVSVIDGDSRQSEDERDKVYRLPGGAPEATVFDDCVDKWPSIGGKLSVALLQKFEDSDKVLKICQDIRRSNKDTHLLFSQLGERLGLVPERTVSAAFTTLWAQANDSTVQTLIGQIVKAADT